MARCHSFLSFLHVHSYMLRFTHPAFAKTQCKYRARILKLLRSPGIDSKASIPPAYVAWRASTRSPIPTRFLATVDCLKLPTQDIFFGIWLEFLWNVGPGFEPRAARCANHLARPQPYSWNRFPFLRPFEL